MEIVQLLASFTEVPFLTIGHLWDLFCCALLACHEGCGRSPSVSEISEKTDLPTVQDIAKNQLAIMQTKLINAEVS